MMKIAVAMSGGVDSSVAAALLREQGHDVIGITMRLPRDGDAVAEAARAAGELGIVHHVIDAGAAFESSVIAPLCREYQAGRTPNPCVECNIHIKFGAMLDYAMGVGVERLATGHYARLEADSPRGRPVLKKGHDQRKDQSYFLCRLTVEQLEKVMFPLGNMTKKQLLETAASLGITVTERGESQEICFIPDGDISSFVMQHTGEEAPPGPIIDTRGTVRGEHHGITGYTIGQRRGLGVAAARPLYVTGLDAARNTVIVGEKEETLGTSLTACRLNWLLTRPERPFKSAVKIRYRANDAEAIVTPLADDRVRIDFEKPQHAITPGQTVALYDGDVVLGGGIIERKES